MAWFLSLPGLVRLAIVLVILISWISILVYLFRSVWDVRDSRVEDPVILFEELRTAFQQGLMTEEEYRRICGDIEKRHPGTIRGRAALEAEVEALRRKSGAATQASPKPPVPEPRSRTDSAD